MLALTGSTGAVGGRVAQALVDLQPRLIVRNAARAPQLGLDVHVATYDDATAATSALQGVSVLFMVSASESDQRVLDHRTMIESAVRAGVRHVVYTSFSSAAPDATFTLARDHHDTEQVLHDAAADGTTFTVLRDNFYLDVLPEFADAEGVIRGPAGTGRVAAVARADVADAVVAVLRDPAAHAGATYTLSGGEALTFEEVATRAGAVLGRPLRFEDETLEEAYASRRAAYPDAEPWQLDAWVSTYTAVADGSQAAVVDDVRRLTGHAPRRLEDVLVTP
ncbi:SDR family oxidoreductase [Nocardioides marinquilinus]|uniref:SDR family oxidoreductase n=1 Tax=Nocardioides marinquilinus TaxID=1210400 RepID=A0ABP9PIR2_9ACTN